jgi:hypothetical protein
MPIIFAPTKKTDFSLTGHQYAFDTSITDSKAPDGTAALKFILNASDPIVSSSKRAELELKQGAAQESEYWYGLSYWFEKYDADNGAESILQWHDQDGTTPPLSIQIAGGRMRIMQSFTSGNIPTDIGAVATGRWTNILLHVKWTTGNTGVLEVWRDGVKVVSKVNIRTNSRGGSYLKLGINKWSWAPGGGASTATQRIFDITDFHIGDAGSNYAEMTGTVVVPPVPLPNQPPVAVAGPDQVIKLPADTITLNGAASSDPDGKIVSHVWDMDGEPFAETAVATVGVSKAGVYVFNLTVTDDKGATGKDSLTVSVLDADPVVIPKIIATHTTIEIDFDNGAKEFWKDGVKQ